MRTHVTLLLGVIALCLLPACMNGYIAPYPVLGDRTQEIDELRAEAVGGTPQDRYEVGLRYETGMVMPHDYQEAVRWYQQAASQGDPDAQYKLCVMADNGRGMPQDFQQALQWCRLAADQGQARAMYTLGVHYHTARGVAQDLVHAHLWYNLAAANGDAGGAAWRDRLARDMTSAQVAEAHLLAREWYANHDFKTVRRAKLRARS